MIDRLVLIKKLDGLCWAARRYGHDDNGLDWSVTADGEFISDDDIGNADTYHPEAVTLADELLASLPFQVSVRHEDERWPDTDGVPIPIVES